MTVCVSNSAQTVMDHSLVIANRDTHRQLMVLAVLVNMIMHHDKHYKQCMHIM